MKFALIPTLRIATLVVTLVAIGAATLLPAIAQDALTPPTPSTHLNPCIFPAVPTPHALFALKNGKLRAFAPVGSVIALQPTAPPNIQFNHLIITVDRRVVQQYDVLDDTDIGTYALPISALRDSSRRYVECYVTDADNRRISLIAATILARPAETVSPTFSLEMKKERLQIRLANRKTYGNVYCYLENLGLGKLDQESGDADFDLRHLPPGNYHARFVTETVGGELLPTVESEFTIAPRIKIEIPQPKQTYHSTLDNPNMALPVRLLRSETCTATKTRLYIGGELVGEFAPGKLDVSVPLHEVYSGEVPLEAVVVGDDGIESPPESVTIHVKNDDWEKRTFGTATYKEIKTNQERIYKSEQEAQEWVTRALYVSSSRSGFRGISVVEGSRYTVDQIDMMPKNGQAGEYWGKARAATVQMAQLLSRNGDCYLALRMTPWAIQSYRRAHTLAGDGTLTGRIAKARFDRLKKAKLPSP